MDGLWDRLIVAAPSAVAVILMAWIFVAHLDRRNKADREAEVERIKAWQAIGASCHEVQREGHQVMRDLHTLLAKVNGRLSATD